MLRWFCVVLSHASKNVIALCRFHSLDIEDDVICISPS